MISCDFFCNCKNPNGLKIWCWEIKYVVFIVDFVVIIIIIIIIIINIIIIIIIIIITVMAF